MEELSNSFHLGNQVWKNADNHEAKVQLFREAVNRARIMVKLRDWEDSNGFTDTRPNP